MRGVVIRWMSCILGLLLLGLPAAEAVDFNPISDPIPPDYPFRIASKHSGMCWDVPGGDFRRGQALQQWYCHTGASQTWNIVKKRESGRDILLIQNAAHPQYCVGTRQGQLILDKCNAPEGTELAWDLFRHAFHVNRIYPLRVRGCIDVWGATMSEGGPLQLFEDCHGGLNQSWVLLPSR